MMPSTLDFYRLTKDPFDVRPGYGPVLATRPVREGLTWVSEHIDVDHAILCLCGAEGIGRSSLARVLPGRLAPYCRVARLPDPCRPWSELRVAIADQLLLDEALSRASLVTARSQGDRIVIAIDAAERAVPEFLKHLDELLELRGPAREGLLQVVLFARDPKTGQEPLWSWLDARRALVCELDPISPCEIHGYIRKRLESAGHSSGQLFSESAALVVHRHSRGIPRRVNQVCAAVLEEARVRLAREIGAWLVDETMGSVGR